MCGYEAEIGTSIDSSKIILSSLQERQWLDENTEVLFFEQTYYNGNLNSFLMLRISFEKTVGGLLQGQLDIKQLVYKNPKDSSVVFFCYIVFILNMIAEFLLLAKKILVGPRGWDILSLTAFNIMDALTLTYMIKVRLRLSRLGVAIRILTVPYV